MVGRGSTPSLRLGPDNPVATDGIIREAPNAPGHWVEWMDRYLPGEDGAEVLAVGRDVTDRYIAEAKLAESESRFRDLADKSTDVMWRFVREPYPHFDYMSPSVEKVLGHPPAFFLEDFSQSLDVLSDDDRIAIERAFLGEPLPDNSDFHFRHANGFDRDRRDAGPPDRRRPTRCRPRCHRTSTPAGEPCGTRAPRPAETISSNASTQRSPNRSPSGSASLFPARRASVWPTAARPATTRPL